MTLTFRQRPPLRQVRRTLTRSLQPASDELFDIIRPRNVEVGLAFFAGAAPSMHSVADLAPPCGGDAVDRSPRNIAGCETVCAVDFRRHPLAQVDPYAIGSVRGRLALKAIQRQCEDPTDERFVESRIHAHNSRLEKTHVPLKFALRVDSPEITRSGGSEVFSNVAAALCATALRCASYSALTRALFRSMIFTSE